MKQIFDYLENVAEPATVCDKNGKRQFVHHTPWYEEDGDDVSGLIEFVIDMPDEHPTYNRDKN